MKPKHALVREPGSKFPLCITDHPNKNTINVRLSRQQHTNYCNILAELGLEVINLPREDKYPDSCFVEDNAIIQKGKALITRMGIESRRGEELSVEQVLQDYMKTQRAVAPATIEGGDIIHLPDRFISGLTQRTNKYGIRQIEQYFDVKVDVCVDPTIIHLKSYITYLGNNYMISTKSYSNHPVLKDFNVLEVPDNENYAANTLTIGNTVLMPNGYPHTQAIVNENGFEVISLNMSEFQKCEGALTCLSLLF
ncbi:MAG: dimethylarginine dimethylaminohydrolase family protein [Candidatus Hodarchaeales archaeon]|jgi:dimethylargininase